MKVFLANTIQQEAELLSELSFHGLSHPGCWVQVWEQLMGYDHAEGKKRRKQLRKEGYITRKTVELSAAEGTRSLWVCCRRNNAEAVLNASVKSGTGTGNVSSNGATKRSKVPPITQGIPYIASHTQRTWNALAKEVGLPSITSVGGTRLSKLQARFKECFGKPESIWGEVIDGVRSSVRKHPALAKSSWLDFDHVLQSQKNFDKARQGRIAVYGEKKQEANEYVPSYLGGGRR
jgi:hypothetical protein